MGGPGCECRKKETLTEALAARPAIDIQALQAGKVLHANINSSYATTTTARIDDVFGTSAIDIILMNSQPTETIRLKHRTFLIYTTSSTITTIFTDPPPVAAATNFARV